MSEYGSRKKLIIIKLEQKDPSIDVCKAKTKKKNRTEFRVRFFSKFLAKKQASDTKKNKQQNSHTNGRERKTWRVKLEFAELLLRILDRAAANNSPTNMRSLSRESDFVEERKRRRAHREIPTTNRQTRNPLTQDK